MQVRADETLNGREYRHLGSALDANNVLHQRWYTPPQSLTGISPINQSRNLLGLALAMERHLAQFYGEGATPSGILTKPGKLTRDQADIVKENDTPVRNFRVSPRSIPRYADSLLLRSFPAPALLATAP